MAVIMIRGLGFAYPGREPLWEGLDLTLDTGRKTALIGRNGRGKTTLLKLLAGELVPDKGSVRMPVEAVLFSAETQAACAYEAACKYGAETWRVEREASLLGVAQLLARDLSTLSGGERTRVLLAGLFASDAFPLIDEPTDSLDRAGREAVAKYLAAKRGFVLASHDRAFLDACTDRVLSLDRTGAVLVTGTVSSYLTGVAARERNLRAENQRLRGEIERLELAATTRKQNSLKAEKAKYGVGDNGLKADRGAVGHKAAKVMKSAMVLEARLEKEAQSRRALLKDCSFVPDIRLYPLSFRRRELLSCRGFSAFYGDKPAFENVTLTSCAGSRVAVTGGNGSGKSTLLTALAGKTDATLSGTLTRPGDLIVSYVPQQPAFCGTVRQICKRAGADPALVNALLFQLGLKEEDFTADTARMSLGQRKKTALAVSLAVRAHLYIWDEPLNYVDMESRMQIERLIVYYKPTMLFVEHDAAFVERVSTDAFSLTRNDFRSKT